MRLAKKRFHLTLRVRGLAEAANCQTAQQSHPGVYTATNHVEIVSQPEDRLRRRRI